MSAIWQFLKSKLGRYVAVVLATLTAIGLHREHWRRRGKAEAENDARDDADKRVDEGRRALRRGRGGDPAQRLRDNDGRWD